MTRILLAIATVGLLLFESSPGRAAYLGVAPWCAVMEVGAADVEWDCEYASVEACAPNVVAGNRGFCALNPYYSPPPRYGATRTKGHARRHSHTQ
ncbi:MAG TPA: DUF3551 domain-containing protein [Xanthobacteraceae bacterium]|nr:DUF3551 domain-containing protein [Xanthobacteraceae bacterium]